MQTYSAYDFKRALIFSREQSDKTRNTRLQYTGSVNTIPLLEHTHTSKHTNTGVTLWE